MGECLLKRPALRCRAVKQHCCGEVARCMPKGAIIGVDVELQGSREGKRTGHERDCFRFDGWLTDLEPNAFTKIPGIIRIVAVPHAVWRRRGWRLRGSGGRRRRR